MYRPERKTAPFNRQKYERLSAQHKAAWAAHQMANDDFKTARDELGRYESIFQDKFSPRDRNHAPVYDSLEALKKIPCHEAEAVTAKASAILEMTDGSFKDALFKLLPLIVELKRLEYRRQMAAEKAHASGEFMTAISETIRPYIDRGGRSVGVMSDGLPASQFNARAGEGWDAHVG